MGFPKTRRRSFRFQREAKAASALNHPNICTIYETDDQHGEAFIAMEFLDAPRSSIASAEGQSRRMLCSLWRLNLPTHWMPHTPKESFHRDIKPANVFVTQRDMPRFSISDSPNSPSSPKAWTSTRRLWRVSHQPRYRAWHRRVHVAEQVRARELDARTDLFSFGVVLYEMATGVLPFRGESTGDIFDSILNRAPVPPVRLNADVPAELERIIAKCLEKDRNLRYQNASEIRTDLQRMRRDTDSARVTADSKPRASTGIAKRWRAIVPAAAAILALFVAGYFYFQSAPGPRAARLTDKDTIVLADFINTTGDAVFDGTLRQGLPSNSSNRPF